MTPTLAEVVTPPEFPYKEELESDFAPTTEELRKSHALTPYIPPHRRVEAFDARKGKNHCSRYKTQKAMPSHKHTHMPEMNHRSKYKTQNAMTDHNYAQVPEIRCVFI